jgi:N6-L-threonylcarbamoyladenine synthase
MRILGIETSCDETSVAVVDDGWKVHSNIISSSAADHAALGGIVPENAARKQLEVVNPVYITALEEAGFEADTIDMIAVTHSVTI